MRARVAFVALVAGLFPMLAGCLGPTTAPPYVRVPDEGGCPPIPRGMVSVEVEGAGSPLKHVVLVRANRYLPQLSCAAPGRIEMMPSHGNATASGIVATGTFQEVRLVFADRVLRAATELVVPEFGGMLRARVRNASAELVWEGALLVVDRTEVQPDPFALERQGRDITFDLVNGTQSFPLAVSSSWNRGFFVGYSVRANAPWDEGEGYHGPAGSLSVRLVDPQGDPRRLERVDLPYGHESFSFGPLKAGNWTLALDAVSEGGPGIAGAQVYWYFDV